MCPSIGNLRYSPMRSLLASPHSPREHTHAYTNTHVHGVPSEVLFHAVLCCVVWEGSAARCEGGHCTDARRARTVWLGGAAEVCQSLSRAAVCLCVCAPAWRRAQCHLRMLSGCSSPHSPRSPVTLLVCPSHVPVSRLDTSSFPCSPTLASCTLFHKHNNIKT